MSSNQGPEVMPADDVVQAMLASNDPNPIVMVNLLKVKDQQELDRYSKMVFPLIAMHGGSLVYSGPVADTFIGDSTWDLVVLVRYPSRKAFAEMILSEDYTAAAQHRIAGLELAEGFMTDG
jgi:uncharacterized protein (DUF1330 family)